MPKTLQESVLEALVEALQHQQEAQGALDQAQQVIILFF